VREDITAVVIVPYRRTADPVLKMVGAGIIADDQDVELLDGVVYLMTKAEMHNPIGTRVAELHWPLAPAGYHAREEKSTATDPHSLPEPDATVVGGELCDSLPPPAEAGPPARGRRLTG
jgi:hypothetical protein